MNIRGIIYFDNRYHCESHKHTLYIVDKVWYINSSRLCLAQEYTNVHVTLVDSLRTKGMVTLHTQ